MKPLKCFAILFFVVSVPQFLFAEDENTIFYYSRMTTIPTKFSLDDLDKITFTDNSILLWKRSGLLEINFEDFLLFTFKEIEHPYVSAVKPISTLQDDPIYIGVKNRMVNIESRLPLSSIVVYDLQGRVAAKDTSASTNYFFSLSAAPAGVYFIKAMCNGRSIIKKIVL